MRRWLLAMVLLAGIVNLSWADYVVIRIILPAADQGPAPTGGAAVMPPVATLTTNDFVEAVVEVTHKRDSVPEFTGGRKDVTFPFLYHKWGRTFGHLQLLDGKEIFMQFIASRPPKKPAAKGEPEFILKTPLMQYAERTGKGKDASLDGQLKLAFWCLEVGLPDKCEDVLNELEKLAAAPDAGAPPAVTAALNAYKQIKPILGSPIAKKDKAENWKVRLKYAGVSSRSHYALVHDSQDPTRDGVDRILNALENNFRSFYLVFALKGKALPAPREKLTAILAGDMNVFQKFARGFEAPERVTDGIHLRHENIVVFAPERLDKAARRFDQEMKALGRTYAGIDLLKGKFRKLAPYDKKGDQKTNEAIRDANSNTVLQDGRAQIFALVEAALRDEAETAVATHDGSRQLIVETGLVPGNMDVPEWLRYGLASLFEMPKGPLPTDNHAVVNYAFWAGADAPHWAWRRCLDELIKGRVIPEQPNEALLKTLTGLWFYEAHILRAQPKGEVNKEMVDAAANIRITTGRCLSWALNYYLFNERFAEYMTFLNEIGNLPRDVELDHYTFLMTFCRVFHIDTTGLLPTKLDGNLSAYGDLSKAWLDSMRRSSALNVPVKWKEPPKKIDPKNPNPMMN